MKTFQNSLILLGLLLLAPNAFTQFMYSTNGNSIIINGYEGPAPGMLVIPDSINGLPVAAINENAFEFDEQVTSVTIPGQVTNIGSDAFNYCVNLTNASICGGVIGGLAFANCTNLQNVCLGTDIIAIPADAFQDCYSLTNFSVSPLNGIFSSLNGVLFESNQTTLFICPGGIPGCYSVPSGVTNIAADAFMNCIHMTRVSIADSVLNVGSGAFTGCDALTNVIIGAGVTNIGAYAFDNCYGIKSFYFLGNTPAVGSMVFSDSVGYRDYLNAAVYYLPGTTNWSQSIAPLPTILWQPVIQPGSMGIQGNQFGFNILNTNAIVSPYPPPFPPNVTTNLTVLVEYCTNLANPTWIPLQTITLTSATNYFTDPTWTNASGRFYNLGIP